jgi:hypothetical protein
MLGQKIKYKYGTVWVTIENKINKVPVPYYEAKGAFCGLKLNSFLLIYLVRLHLKKKREIYAI